MGFCQSPLVSELRVKIHSLNTELSSCFVQPPSPDTANPPLLCTP